MEMSESEDPKNRGLSSNQSDMEGFSSDEYDEFSHRKESQVDLPPF